MICRLYELYNDTGIDVGHDTDCTPKCADYIEDTNACRLCSEKEVRLCKKLKFGWTKVRTIQFTGVEIVEDEDTAYQILKLIHPAKNNIWIIKWLSKNKDGDISEKYTLHSTNKEFELKDLFELNIFLKNRADYDGRNIAEKDFDIRRL